MCFRTQPINYSFTHPSTVTPSERTISRGVRNNREEAFLCVRGWCVCVVEGGKCLCLPLSSFSVCLRSLPSAKTTAASHSHQPTTAPERPQPIRPNGRLCCDRVGGGWAQAIDRGNALVWGLLHAFLRSSSVCFAPCLPAVALEEERVVGRRRERSSSQETVRMR